MKITKIKMRYLEEEASKRIKAIANITFNNCITLKDIRVVYSETSNKNIVVMPASKYNDKYYDYFFPVNTEVRDLIVEKVIELYESKENEYIDETECDELQVSVSKIYPVYKNGTLVDMDIVFDNSFVITRVYIIQKSSNEIECHFPQIERIKDKFVDLVTFLNNDYYIKVCDVLKNEYKKYESKTDGWDAITKEAERVYPGQNNPKHYGTLIKYRLGGQNPLDGISIYDGGDYYHFVTYGLSELYGKESNNSEISGFGMEFTLKLKKAEYKNEEAELKCICGIFQSIASLTFKNGELFNEYEHLYSGQTTGIDANGESNITAFITIPDTNFNSIDTPNGKVKFVEFVGITNDEVTAIRNKQITVKELYEKLGSDITDYNRESVINSEIVNENIKPSEDEYDKLIQRLNEGNSENKKYDFNWDATLLLNYADDSSLEMAYRLIEIGKISIESKENKINILSYLIGFCDCNDNNDDFFDKVEKEPAYYIKDSKGSWKITNGILMRTDGCANCKYQSCPKQLAAYILYLKNTGKLKEKLIERKEFRNNNDVANGFFLFEWKNENGLRKIKEADFEFANKLVENDLVRLKRSLNKKNGIETNELAGCKELQLSGLEFSKLKYDVTWDDSYSITRSKSCNPDFLCDSFDCRLTSCPTLVAAYIYYLKMSNREEKIKEDREYYRQHKEEIDRQIDEEVQNKINNLNESKEKKLQEFKTYDGKIENLTLTLNNILQSNNTNLHCIIVGDEEEDKDLFIDKIVELIKSQDAKVNYIRALPIKTFTEMYIYQTGVYISKNDELIYTDMVKEEERPPKKRDKDGILYWTGHVNRTPRLENNAIYILNDMKNFVDGFKKLDKQIAISAIASLSNMSCNNYIILKASPEEVASFIALDTRLKFVYQNNVITLPEYSIDDMYDAYLKRLNIEVLNELNQNAEEYKKQFNEYVSMNKKFMPFNSVEMINYMATYANTRNEMIFPPYVYKKESVDESLKNIIGLENVKEKLKEFEKFMIFQIKASANKIKIASSNMHMIFTGNPGTGKTTVARIMAKMLFDLGIIKENKIIEVERKDLIAGYIGQTAIKTGEVIDKALGGVLFIDEAYSLADRSDFSKEAIATLIKAMEDHKDELIVIFAGYKNEMKKFLEMNSGISSRIGYTFDFPDYSVDELMQIFYLKLKNMNFEYTEETKFYLQKVCTYYSKRKSFGNGRFIDKLLQETFIKHAKRDECDIKIIDVEDIPTIEDLNPNSKDKIGIIDDELDKIIGLDALKEQIKKFAKYVKFVKETEKNQINLPNNNMHMMFVGNPGTGKTTVARIMAKILYDMDIIHENKLVEVERKDLVGDYPNESAEKVEKAVENALGGILFIDEAYSLSSTYDNIKKTSSSNESVAIATLIKAMEDRKGEFIVIFAGYKNEMKTFMDMNSGIKSRVGYTFEFTDYTEDELLKMFNLKLKQIGFNVSDDIEIPLRRIFRYFAKRKNFGNGRFVDRIIQEAIMKHSETYSDILTIEASDIPTIDELIENKKKNFDNAKTAIDNLVGLSELKKKLYSFSDYVKFLKEAEERKIYLPSSNMHMIFTGNPGTGKTTVARIIAQMLYEIGIIHENKLVEVERKDLIAGYVGQTAIKTGEVIERAIGGVLFIDEAYTLAMGGNEHNFGAEAIATLIKAMEDHKDELVVIFAGYKNEMREFVEINPGIASRIGYIFDFTDYDNIELTEIFKRKVEKSGLTLDENVLEEVKKIMKYFYKVENIGNGRFVDKVYSETIMKHSKRFANSIKDNNEEITTDDIIKITVEDLPTIQEITQTLLDGKSMPDLNKIKPEDYRKTAIHEVGHATITYLLTREAGIKKITCTAEGWGALGYVEMDKNGDAKYVHSKEELLNLIKRLLAGIAAEEVFLGFYKSGGSSDLRKATSIANEIITKYGMSDLGLAYVSSNNYELQKIIYEEENKILGKCFEEVKETIRNNKENMQRVVEYLLEKGEISSEEFIRFFNGENIN